MNTTVSSDLISQFPSHRRVVVLGDTNFTSVAAVITTVADSRNGILALPRRVGFYPPVFLYSEHAVELPAGITAIVNGNKQQWLESEPAACQCEKNLLPPFYGTLTQYVEIGNNTFAYPGHQHGAFSEKHPAGHHFYDFFDENVFRADICNANVRLGNLLIHEGSTKDVQEFVAKVFHIGETYFVLNGILAANKVATNALLTHSDLVFFGCNNHKSNHHGALIQAEVTPVYLEASRNPFSFIGDIDAHCFNEEYLRQQIHDAAPEGTRLLRPSHPTIIQLGTYNGAVYNARQVISTVGYLYDYILFDSARADYKQFIPMMMDSSPLLLELGKNDPRIFMTQPVYKQQAGFSQASRIHKKDNHIHGQARFCLHKRLNSALMLHASTSPFYPLFAVLDANARIHEGESGRRLQAECVKLNTKLRKTTLARCELFCLFIPPVVNGKLWQGYPTSVLTSDRHFFSFEPGTKQHSFEGYAVDQYFVDPCGLLFTTPGINTETDECNDSGVPVTILAHYLRENGVVLEKRNFNSILFLLAPAESRKKLAQLVTMLTQFEQHVEGGSPLAEVLPSVYNKCPMCYRDYAMRQLCQEMHDLYVSFGVKDLQRAISRQQSFPSIVINPQDAYSAHICGEMELMRIHDAEG